MGWLLLSALNLEPNFLFYLKFSDLLPIYIQEISKESQPKKIEWDRL